MNLRSKKILNVQGDPMVTIKLQLVKSSSFSILKIVHIQIQPSSEMPTGYFASKFAASFEENSKAEKE